MDLNFSEEEQQFRHEVRIFIEENLPEDIRRKGYAGIPVTKSENVRWQKILGAKGWLAPNWPEEYGGPGWGPVKRFIFDEELALGCAPRANLPAIDLLGPVLIEFGTEKQKQTYLPPILTSEDWWCQGFSEPEAGSDLASLQCKAERIGDHYLVNGTKIWTSHAHNANWIFCLVRTSNEGKKQAGISFLLISMDTPGLTVRPIHTLGGFHVVNQIFLGDVRVPAENLVGNEGDGWTITKFILGHERLLGAGLSASWKLLKQLKVLSNRLVRNGQPLSEDERFREHLASYEVDLLALQYVAYAALCDEEAGRSPGPEVSVLKLKGTQIQQGLAEMLMESVGPNALAEPASFENDLMQVADEETLFATSQYFDRRKLSIYGGSSEIQRNIISRRIIDL